MGRRVRGLKKTWLWLNMAESRTKKTLRNVQVALVYYIINLLLNFFSRKVFLDRLGPEVLGLNTTASNLLGFLNIAELGLGAAISYSLYKPLFENDRKKVQEIVSVQGWFYRRVAYIVIAGTVVLLCFFPIIFSKADVPIWYAYATFGALLFSSLIGYFVNYRQIVFTADQKEYKITISLKGFTIVKVILQMLAICFLSNGYVYWLILEVVIAGISAFVLNILLIREYPWLKTSPKDGVIYRKNYPEIFIKTKQLFCHKIGSFVLTRTSPLIIYAFTSLTIVANYGNYMLIISGVSLLSNALFSSLTAGVGSLVAEGKKGKILDFFWQLSSFQIWFGSLCCYLFYVMAHPFITFWVGSEYLLDDTSLFLLAVYLFIILTRISDIFRSAYGLFGDIWAPIIETILNLSFSIVFGRSFGLSGIIAGMILSLVIIVICWHPTFVFRNAFLISPLYYWKNYIKYLFLIGFSLLCVYLFGRWVGENYLHNIVIISFFKIIIYMICSLILFMFFERRMKYIFLYAYRAILRKV
jgi:O-antigen/teichoic acid export membrane protein